MVENMDARPEDADWCGGGLQAGTAAGDRSGFDNRVRDDRALRSRRGALRSTLAALGLVLATALPALGLGGCAILAEEVASAQRAYDKARFETALVWLTDLEPHAGSMAPALRARFYFLRGMAAYRVGGRPDALHFLALCREVADSQGVGLRADWRKEMERVLSELSEEALPALSSGGEARATDS